MPLIIADRVKETTSTTGTGTVTLLGASTGFQSFAAIGNSNTTYYTIAGQIGSEWEVGIGTYTTSGTTLARTTVLSSSNTGSLVNFSAGTKDVFVTYPAGKSVNLDASNNSSALGTPSSGVITNLTGTASININGTVGATTPTTVVGTTGSFSGNLSFNSGYGSSAVAYGCRAWVNFNGTGVVAIRASGNVSSITDNGVGNYTVNFATAMVDANYSVGQTLSAQSSSNDGGHVVIAFGTSLSTTSFNIVTDQRAIGEYDPSVVCLSVFR
jgi:hypothetical protein